MFYKLLISHYIADFLLQTRWMGNNKSNNIKALLFHIVIYTGVLIIFPFKQDQIIYALLNGIAHFITDFFSSKASSYFYKQNNLHAFWAVIGLDQLLHVIVLYFTFTLL